MRRVAHMHIKNQESHQRDTNGSPYGLLSEEMNGRKQPQSWHPWRHKAYSGNLKLGTMFVWI